MATILLTLEATITLQKNVEVEADTLEQARVMVAQTQQLPRSLEHLPGWEEIERKVIPISAKEKAR